MIGKLKSILGIEGPKIKIRTINTKTPGLIQGTLSISTVQKAIVQEIDIVLKENYASGRAKKHARNEFILGQNRIEQVFDLKENSVMEINFTLEYSLIKSKLDKLNEANPWLSPLTGFVKIIRGVKSTYHLDLTAKIKGTSIPATDHYLIEKLN